MIPLLNLLYDKLYEFRQELNNNTNSNINDKDTQDILLTASNNDLEAPQITMKKYADISKNMKWIRNFDYEKDIKHVEELLSELKKTKFVDREFPANDNAITPVIRLFPRAINIGWRRATDIYSGKMFCIFSNEMGPSDIMQGEVGDCYFLSVLSVLAERPHIIQRLFITDSINKNGCYSLWLCDSGEWKAIIMDDYIPIRIESGKPVFTIPKNNQIWVTLIEKAFAKLCGSFYGIQAGVEGEAFRLLTGAPVDYLDHDILPIAEKENATWNFLILNIESDFFLTVSTRLSTKDLKQKDFGLVSNHSYGILDAKEIFIGKDKNGNNINEKLIKLRNPWGNMEWNGEWDDQSNKWTNDILKQVNYHPNHYDGIFWMPLKDFLKHFGRICCCKFNPNYLYNWLPLFHESPQNISIVKMRIYEPTHLHVSLVQRAKRHYKGLIKLNYDYSKSRISICKLDDYLQTMNIIIEKEYMRQANTVEGMFIKGDYYVILNIEWNQDYCRKFVISTYSSKEIQLIEVSSTEKENIIRNYLNTKFIIPNIIVNDEL